MSEEYGYCYDCMRRFPLKELRDFTNKEKMLGLHTKYPMCKRCISLCVSFLQDDMT